MAATAGLKRSTCPTIRVTPARLRGGDDLAPLFDRRCDRLLDQDMDIARDAGERDLVMQMGGRGDRHRVDALGDQFVEAGKGAAADQLGRARAMFRQRIDNADKCRRPADRPARGHGWCPSRRRRSRRCEARACASAFVVDTDRF